MARAPWITRDYLEAHRGETIYDIAATLNRTPAGVRNAIHNFRLNPLDYGIRVWGNFHHKITPDFLETNKTRHADEVAAEIGCTREYLLDLYKKHGIKRDQVRRYRHNKADHIAAGLDPCHGCPCEHVTQCQTTVAKGQPALCELHLPEDIE